MLESARKPASEVHFASIVNNFQEKTFRTVKIFPRNVGEMLKSARKPASKILSASTGNNFQENKHSALLKYLPKCWRNVGKCKKTCI
jgi:hypothetical protein